MGNCIIKEQWGGDDWEADFPTTSGSDHHDHHHKHLSAGTSYRNSDDDDKIKLVNPSSSLSSMSSDTYNDDDGDDTTSKRRRKTRVSSDQQHQVKIKITRKQLEELLGGSKIINHIEDEGLSMVHEVVYRFLNAGNDFLDSHQRSWRPALSTITEVN